MAGIGELIQIPETTFSELIIESGVVLDTLDITGATPIANEDILCATSGGLEVACVPEYEDMGADVDNCPEGMAEMMQIVGWKCSVKFTALNATAKLTRLNLGAADIAADGVKITPRMTLAPSDFQDIWIACKRTDGGWAAVRLMNALSTSGLVLRTSKKGKGQYTHELSGHFSIRNQNVVPMEFYIQAGTAAEGGENSGQSGQEENS